VSWWDVGDGGVIGDGPADVLELALSSVAHDRDVAGRPKPSLASVLGGMAAALSAGGGASRPRVAATLTDGSEVFPDASGEDIAIAFREALAEVQRQYQERWERAPSRHELLETLLFVLVGAASSFLRDVKADEIQSIAERS
jgi:hypothetical protein